ncbi:MAG: threonine synthase [Halovenus sp.]
MNEGLSFQCAVCDRRLGLDEMCPSHPDTGPPRLAIETDSIHDSFDPDRATRRDIWRYAPLLPVGKADPVTLGEGWTDLVTADRIGDRLGVDLDLKREGANPSGSTKDRGSSVLVTHARGQNHERVTCASTGNAAASLAAYAARGGLGCSLFVPEHLPDAKALQPRAYGADLVTVAGGYGEAVSVCRQQVAEHGWLDRSAGATALPATGARTLGYELAEQTTDPDWVVVPVGNGGTLADLARGWETFRELGYSAAVPRMLGVQARETSAIHDMVRERRDTVRTATQEASPPQGTAESDLAARGRTCADSIDVANPNRARAAREAIADTGGTTVTVGDGAIQDAIRTLARDEGLFAEPASAAGLAGLVTAVDRGIVDPGDRVVVVITGTGFKDTETVADSL